MSKKNQQGLMALIVLVICMIIALCACDKDSFPEGASNGDGVVGKESVDTTYKVYYLNQDGLSIEGVSKIYTAGTPKELVKECLDSLAATPEKHILKSTIPEDVSVLYYTYDAAGKQVDVYFSKSYSEIEKNVEILVRAAIVKTLTQFDGVIDYVQFFINGQAMTENGKKLLMMKSDFVDNTKADVNHLNQSLIRLYFASTDGTQLAYEDVQVHYYKTSPLPKIVVESLISGPISKNLNSTMSSDVKLLNVEVLEGICYVDFNQRFLDRVNDQSFALNVYSVVNSLTELEEIDKVQIKIDGDIIRGNDDSLPLNVLLERNDELVVIPMDTPPVIETSDEVKVEETLETE